MVLDFPPLALAKPVVLVSLTDYPSPYEVTRMKHKRLHIYQTAQKERDTYARFALQRNIMQTGIPSKLHATQHCSELFDRTQRSHEVPAATKTPTEILSERESER